MRPYGVHNLQIRQRGATLVIALIILLVMTVIGVATMKSSTLQERMAANARQKTIARNAAETALRVAEDWLDANVRNTTALNLFDGSRQLFSSVPRPGGKPASPLLADLTDQETWDAVGVEINGISTLNAGLNQAVDVSVTMDAGKIARQPKFVIQYVGRDLKGTANKVVLSLDAEDQGDGDTSPFYFRITAIGWGRDSNIFSVLESNYRTGYGDDVFVY